MFFQWIVYQLHHGYRCRDLSDAVRFLPRVTELEAHELLLAVDIYRPKSKYVALHVGKKYWIRCDLCKILGVCFVSNIRSDMFD